MNKINSNKTIETDLIRLSRQAETNSAGPAKSDSVKSGTVTGQGDKLNFSKRASEVSKLVDGLKNLPDVRSEKINELKQKIANGEYRPSSTEIADAILKEET